MPQSKSIHQSLLNFEVAVCLHIVISNPPMASVHYSTRILVHGNEEHQVCPVISSDVSLSFWGGIDEETGIVIDTTHPLHGVDISGSILCLPSGRGSCTASQVLLELILNEKAPKALVLRDRDGLVRGMCSRDHQFHPRDC